MIRRVAMATVVLGVASTTGAAFGQTAIPATPVPTPPVGPTSPTLQPELFGQFLQRGESVLQRPRPEYDPIGIRLGGFFLYSKLDTDEVYNDNVYATKTYTRSDFITVVSPTFDLLSNWTSSQLNFHAGSSVGTYARSSTENYGDYFAGVDGRYDITPYFDGIGSAKYEHLHFERDAIDSPILSRYPVQFDQYTGNIGFSQHDRRIGYVANLQVLRDAFQNGEIAVPGLSYFTPLNNELQNLNIFTPSLRVSYELAPRYEAFILGSGNIQRYDHSVQGLGLGGGLAKEDSTGYNIQGGVTIDLTGVTYIELGLGYLEQQYVAPTLSSISGFAYSARLVWNVTELTSVSLRGARDVQDSQFAALQEATGAPIGTIVNSPGYLRSTAVLSIDHELLRNLLLHGELGYENDNFVGINSIGDEYDVGIGARYLINQNLYLGASYNYTLRSTSGTVAAIPAFNRDLLMLRLGVQM